MTPLNRGKIKLLIFKMAEKIRIKLYSEEQFFKQQQSFNKKDIATRIVNEPYVFDKESIYLLKIRPQKLKILK